MIAGSECRSSEDAVCMPLQIAQVPQQARNRVSRLASVAFSAGVAMVRGAVTVGNVCVSVRVAMVRPAVTLASLTCRLMAPSLGSFAVPMQMMVVRQRRSHGDACTCCSGATAAVGQVACGDSDSEASSGVKSEDVEKATWMMAQWGWHEVWCQR
jgi:hypothetical protein